MSDQFIIKWFRENTTGAVEDLGLGNPVEELTGIKTIDQFSSYHEAALFNHPYSPSLLGKYWCQLINTTADPDQPLMRSNVFTLLAPGDYNGPTCNSLPGLKYQSVGNIACADDDDQSAPSMSSVATHQAIQCIVSTG